MARRDHFGPQLQLFIPAHVLMSEAPNFRHGDLRDGESVEDLAQEKVDQSKTRRVGFHRFLSGESPTLYDSIAQEGVKDPVRLVIDTDSKTGETVTSLFDGHHRAASAAAISKDRAAENLPNPNMEVPVTYDGTFRYVAEHYPKMREANWEKYL